MNGAAGNQHRLFGQVTPRQLKHSDTGDMLSPEISRIIPFFLGLPQYQERGAALLLLIARPCDE